MPSGPATLWAESDSHAFGSYTPVSLNLRLKDLLGPVTRATKKKKRSHALIGTECTHTSSVRHTRTLESATPIDVCKQVYILVMVARMLSVA